MLPYSLGTLNFVSLLKTYASRNDDVSSSSRCVTKSKSGDQIRINGRSHSSRSEMLVTFLSVLGHVAGMVLVTYILQHHTLSHPFLLADNRYALARTLTLS
jgi:Tfp pilus assembly protein PilN